MNDEKIIEQLENFKPTPSREWQNQTLKNLQTYVTNTPTLRNRSMNIFNSINLFNYLNMNTGLRSVVAVASVVATFAALGGTVYASDSAAPGELLYPLDKMTEQVRRILTVDPTNRARFELAVIDERIGELARLSENGNANNVSTSISEIEAQKTRLRVQLEEMNKLRAENKIQTQEQLQVMEQLQMRVQENEASMNQVQNKLEDNGDTSNSENLQKIQNQYSEEMGNQIQNFEAETGVKLQEKEAEQNQGEDTQNQNQNQIQNGDDSGNGTVQGVQQQGKN